MAGFYFILFLFSFILLGHFDIRGGNPRRSRCEEVEVRFGCALPELPFPAFPGSRLRTRIYNFNGSLEKKKRFRSPVQTVLGCVALRCVALRYSHMSLHTRQPARPARPAHHTPPQIPKCNSYDAISHVVCLAPPPLSPSLDTGTKTPKSSGPNIPKALEPATRQRRPLVCKGRVNAITAETPHSLYVAI